MKKIFLKALPYFFTLTLIIIGFTLSAQVPGGGGPPGGTSPSGGCFPNPCVPIDGGISYLIAAGIALGGKKLYDASKK